jgi:hypothetical protein
MLNFYGMRLVDEQTGQIERETDIWRDRYRNLSTNSHNFLRISKFTAQIVLILKGRIIISLGEMGFKRYKQPFVDHFIKEIKQNEVLKACKRSLEDFWIPLLDETSAAYVKVFILILKLEIGILRRLEKTQKIEQRACTLKNKQLLSRIHLFIPQFVSS